MADGLRLVSINTWKCDGDYPTRARVLERQLAALAPDLVALQESFASLDGRYDTAARLGRALGMAVAFLPERRKVRAVAGTQLDSHSGLAVLSRLPVEDERHLPLPSSTEDGGRSAQLLRVRLGGRRIALGNLHLTHLADETLRRRQLAAVLDHLWLNDDADLAVVCGDFNAAPDAPGLRDFLAPKGAWRDACAGIAGKRTFPTAEGGLDLDHILVRVDRPMAVTGAAIVLDAPDPASGVMASDHYGVSAVFA